MQDLPSIFFSDGRMVELQPEVIAALDPADHKRLNVVRRCYAAVTAAQDAAKEISDQFTDAVKRLRELESYRDRHFGKQGFHSLWLETFGR